MPEAAHILFQLGLFTALRSQQHLLINEIERRVPTGLKRGVAAQAIFNRLRSARAPAFRLIGERRLQRRVAILRA
jgi:hypothetical protein